MSVWKSDETLLSICILNFSFKNDFVWEEISNILHSVSSPDETPRSSSKILRCASYFQLSSRCFIWWWNTASHVWYIALKLKPSLCRLVTWAALILKEVRVFISILGAKEETKLKGDISAYFNIEIMVIPSSFLQSFMVFMCSVNIEDVNVFP